MAGVKRYSESTVAGAEPLIAGLIKQRPHSRALLYRFWDACAVRSGVFVIAAQQFPP